VDIPSDNTFVILLENYKLYDYKNPEENNIIPNMGILEHRNSISIDNDILDINDNNIIKIRDINDYLTLTMSKFKKFKKEETLYNKELLTKSKKVLKSRKTGSNEEKKRKIKLSKPKI